MTLTMGSFTTEEPTILEWNNDSNVIVGNYTSIAKDVTIFAGGEHRTNTVSTFPFKERLRIANAKPICPFSKGDVTIGNDVWIGFGVTILSGVTIGDGAVIGAKSVVASDVLPYTIVAGNPARVIKYRFTREQISALLKIQWWNWPLEKVIKFVNLITSDDIDKFIVKASGT